MSYREQNSAPHTYNFAAKPEPFLPQGKYRPKPNPGSSSKIRENESKKPTFLGSRLELLPLESEVKEIEIEPYFFIDKAPPAEYKPKDKGLEVATQIDDNELFDFDLEVIPLIQVLAGRSLEEAQIEIDEEDENAETRKHKERRDLQHKSKQELAKQAHKKFVYKSVVKSGLQGFKNGVIRSLFDLKFLDEQRLTHLKANLVPLMINDVIQDQNERVNEKTQFCQILSSIETALMDLHREAVKNEMHRRKVKKETEEKERIEREEAKRKRKARRLAKRICSEKTANMNFINEHFISKKVKVHSIDEGKIGDAFGDKDKAVLFTYGGIIFGIWQLISILRDEFKLPISNDIIRTLVKECIIHFHPGNPISLRYLDSFESKFQEILKLSHQTVTIETCHSLIENLRNPFLRECYKYHLFDKDIMDTIIMSILKIWLFKKEVNPPNNEEKHKEHSNEKEIEPKAENIDIEKDKEENPEKIGQENQPEIQEESEEEKLKREEEHKAKLEEEMKLEKEMQDLKSKLIISAFAPVNLSEISAIVRIRLPILPPFVEVIEPIPETKEEGKSIVKAKEEKKDGITIKEGKSFYEKGIKKIEHKEGINETIKVEEIIHEPIIENGKPENEIELEEEKNIILEESFIEPFDGTTYDKTDNNSNQYNEKQIEEILESLHSYSISNLSERRILMLDPIAQACLIKFIYSVYSDYVKPAEEGEIKTKNLMKEVFEGIARMEGTYKDITHSKAGELPIFDFIEILNEE